MNRTLSVFVEKDAVPTATGNIPAMGKQYKAFNPVTQQYEPLAEPLRFKLLIPQAAFDVAVAPVLVQTKPRDDGSTSLQGLFSVVGHVVNLVEMFNAQGNTAPDCIQVDLIGHIKPKSETLVRRQLTAKYQHESA